MKEARNNIAARGQDLAAGSFLWALVGLSFFVYPLAVFPPLVKVGQTVLFNLGHTISLPAAIVLGLLAVPVLLFSAWRLPRFLLSAMAVFVIMLLVNIPAEMERLDEFLILFAYVTVPLASAVLLTGGYVRPDRVAAWAASLWGVQLLLGGISIYRQMEPVGTAGNINWMAGLLLMLSPWVVHCFIGVARRYVPHRNAAVALAMSAWLLPTVFVLYHCHSRAAWLVLVLLPAALVVVRMRRLLHKALALGILAAVGLGCLLAAYLYFPNRLLQVVETDVRVPLWTGTGVMIAKHPLGVGAGGFQEAFTPLRRVSSYQNRLYAADMTVHPHNEILNVGAQLGIPAMLAFLVMLAMALRRPARDPLQVCARTSACLTIMLAMFDMTLAQPPTNFLGLFFLGLCWPVSVPGQQRDASLGKWAAPKLALTGAAVCGILVIGWLDLSHDRAMRQGQLAEGIAFSHMDVNDRAEGSKRLGEAIAHYQAAVIPFNHVIPHYQIARLSLMTPGKLDQAEDYLNRVVAADPNFSHVNLLLGRLHLRKGDWAAAEIYFVRECRFFPRSEKAWQNMYAFAAASGRYGRLAAIGTLLEDIYRERARQHFGANGLAARRKSFTKDLQADHPANAIKGANDLLERIHHSFTDPLFHGITQGQQWPPAFVEKGFHILDAAAWQLRHSLHSAMQKKFGALPVSPEALVSWYTGRIAMEPDRPLTFPLGVWNHGAGNALSAYLLFSMVCELNRYPFIISTDATGQPVQAWLFVTPPAQGDPLPQNGENVERPGDGAGIFAVDLAASSCRPVARADFSKHFRWRIGRTLVYFPMTDYFLRNQIMGTVFKDDIPWLPQDPPSKRLIDLFALTRTTPPQPALLARFCFDGHIRQHFARIDALLSRPAR